MDVVDDYQNALNSPRFFNDFKKRPLESALEIAALPCVPNYGSRVDGL